MSKASQFLSFARIFLITSPHVVVPVPESLFFLCERSMVNLPVFWLRLSATSPPRHCLAWGPPPNLLHDSLAWVTRLCQFFGILPLISGFQGACLLSVEQKKFQSYFAQRLLTAPGKGESEQSQRDSLTGKICQTRTTFIKSNLNKKLKVLLKIRTLLIRKKSIISGISDAFIFHMHPKRDPKGLLPNRRHSRGSSGYCPFPGPFRFHSPDFGPIEKGRQESRIFPIN